MLPTPHQQSAKYIPTPMELLLGGNAKSSPATAATAATAAMVPLPRLHAAATTAGTTSLASLLNLPPPIPLQSFQTGLLQQPMQPVGPPSILLQMLEKGTPTAGDHSPSPRVAPLSSSGLATPPLLIATSVSSTETVPSDTGSHESTGTLVRCAPCSMQFASQAKLDMHTRIDHILCDLNGCAFTACKRVVIRHRQDCHPPVGKTFVCLDTPEEIEKWRAERRKRYPTNANMEAKAELPPKSNATKRASEKRVSSSAVAAAEEEGNAAQPHAKRVRLDNQTDDGIHATESSDDDDDEDDDDEDDDDSEPSEEPMGASPVLPEADSANGPSNKRPCKYFARGTCRKGTKCPFAHVKRQPGTKSDSKSTTSSSSSTTSTTSSNHALPNSATSRRLTLVEKLVRTDLARNAQLLLACFQHLLESKTFEQPHDGTGLLHAVLQEAIHQQRG